MSTEAHQAFHARSDLPMPSPLCTTCNPNPTVPQVATVTVKKAVDGTKKRKARSDRGKQRSRSVTEHVVVDPRVMAAAKASMRPGQRLVIVDAECVRLVNT